MEFQYSIKSCMLLFSNICLHMTLVSMHHLLEMQELAAPSDLYLAHHHCYMNCKFFGVIFSCQKENVLSYVVNETSSIHLGSAAREMPRGQTLFPHQAGKRRWEVGQNRRNITHGTTICVSVDASAYSLESSSSSSSSSTP